MLWRIIVAVTVLHLGNSDGFPSRGRDGDSPGDTMAAERGPGDSPGDTMAAERGPGDSPGDTMAAERGPGDSPGNGTRCQPCSPELCPQAAGCTAGLVRDGCGCCQQCANAEGQPCDLGGTGVFHGVCGSDLRCEIDAADLRRGGAPEPQCVCTSQEAVCASDGTTFPNRCRFRDAAYSAPGLRIARSGPCPTAPLIKVPPHNRVNASGSTAIFLCEVFAFPMALIEWRRDGSELVLPGDDPHISVQSRGGPMRYELSSWLQIEGVVPGDAGTYRCVAHNQLGNTSASAVLGVLRPEEMSAFSSEDMPALFTYGPESDYNYDEDYY